MRAKQVLLAAPVLILLGWGGARIGSTGGPVFPALFSLNMLLLTPGGQTYSEDQITGMLAGAGVKEIERIPIQSPVESGIIMGVV